MKKIFLSETFLSICFSFVIGIIICAIFFWGTTAKIWYVGEHTDGCDGSTKCGCYEKLINK